MLSKYGLAPQRPPATHLGFFINADLTSLEPMELLLPKAGERVSRHQEEIISLLSSFFKVAPRRAHECVRPERGENTTQVIPLSPLAGTKTRRRFSAIPALATRGPLAPENRAAGPGFAPREGHELGNPRPAGLGQLAFTGT